MTEETIEGLARRVVRARKAYEEAKKESNQRWAEYVHLSRVEFPRMMEEMGLDSVRIKGLGTFRIREEMSVKTLDKQQLFEWLEQEGLADIVTETVNAGTLKAVIRERMREGESIPDAVEIKTYQNTIFEER